jgi:putative NIF3 family GTP cyclohydrolase 1 type 2
LADVMDLQTDVYAGIGVPVNVAQAIMQERMGEVERRIRPANHTEAVDAARLLDVPLMTLHTVWDNIGNHFMTNYLKQREFDTVGEILDYLMELPEYVASTKGKAGPHIVSGGADSRPGKIAVFFTGGTNPSKEMYLEWVKAGIGTIIDMHMPEESLKEMRKAHVNVIDTGHMASDSIGANIFFDVLEKKGIEVVACSGLVRTKRK